MDENMYQFNQPQQQGGSGLDIASMVLGIIAVVFNCCYVHISLPCGIIGLILGIVSLKKGNSGHGMAIAGVVLSAISLVLYIACIILLAAGFASIPWADFASELNL